MPPKKRLGDALIEQGLITQEQLSEALKVQKVKKMRLGLVLSDLGFCSEEDILTVLSKQLGVPKVNLTEYQVTLKVLELVPAKIAQKHEIIPLFIEGNHLTVAMSDPLDVFVIDQLQYMTGYTIDMVISTREQILGAIQKYYGTVRDMDAVVDEFDTKDDGKSAEMEESVGVNDVEQDNPIVKFVELTIKEAVKEKASDIHVEPEEKNLRIRYRIDGVLQQVKNVPNNVKNAILSRIKIISGMDIAEKRLPQDGRMHLKFEGKEIDIRVSSLPTAWGEKIVMRLLDTSSVMIGIDQLGFLEEQQKQFQRCLKEPNGIILLTGPTGSGKTSTLYAGLNYIKSPNINITTVENPIEYKISLINQVQTKTEIGMTFANALRAILRQDPNVIMIGEIRDVETAEIAIESALTGHLVLSTLHTNDAPQAIVRLNEMGIEPYLLTPTLLLVIAQRLARRICTRCKEEFVPDKELLLEIGLKPEKEWKFFRGKGCSYCNKTGYSGRAGIHESLILNDDIRKMIIAKESASEIKKVAVRCGMDTLRVSAIKKMLMGITTAEEVLRVTKRE
ncbi:MAG: ATPase, T2SS/T4P/T4SS family [Candidatus Wallbacteria bacterium]|nr:ATPase, T2SS/T4P/T4SS family [Candidatus Wallbacteria bacterium]